MDLKQCVAVVTGANRGIGKEVARQLLQSGMKVILGMREPQKFEGLSGDFSSENWETFPLDVSSPQTIQALADHIQKKYGGRIDILVNNAGIFKDDRNGGSALNTSVEVLRETWEVNTLGAFRMCQALMPFMKSAGFGRVVNVSSGLGALTDMGSGMPGYRMSKVALNGLTALLAAEFASTDIRVNSVCPGWVRTDMGGQEATRPVEKGAETIVWAATLNSNGPTGGFFRDKKPVDW